MDNGTWKMINRNKHTLWHHLLMIVYSEIINFMWLSVAIAVILGGVVVFANNDEAFFRFGVGLPLILVGVSLFLFKVHEVILVLVKPSCLRVICLVCRRNHGA